MVRSPVAVSEANTVSDLPNRTSALASTLATDLDEYRRMVEGHAAAMDGEAFFNGTQAHAAIIIENLIKKAENSICILSRCLDPVVYGCDGVLKALDGFFNKNSANSVRVLCENMDELASGNKFASMLSNKGSQATIIPVPAEVASRRSYRFVYSDERNYRYQPDKNMPWRAIAAFNDPRGGESLRDAFDEIMRECLSTSDMHNVGAATSL